MIWCSYWIAWEDFYDTIMVMKMLGKQAEGELKIFFFLELGSGQFHLKKKIKKILLKSNYRADFFVFLINSVKIHFRKLKHIFSEEEKLFSFVLSSVKMFPLKTHSKFIFNSSIRKQEDQKTH